MQHFPYSVAGNILRADGKFQCIINPSIGSECKLILATFLHYTGFINTMCVLTNGVCVIQ